MNNNFRIGFGTWKITDRSEIRNVLPNAIEAGYRLFDTAAAYSNEISIGKVLHEINIRREDLFIQSKLWVTNMGFYKAQEACKRSLKKLKLDYLDAYLIHWPAVKISSDNWEEINSNTFAGFDALKKDGLIKFTGVSNFMAHHLESLLKNNNSLPDINQIEFHPGFKQDETVNFCREKNICIQAHSPLGHGDIIKNDTLIRIAAAHEKTPAQICLRWEIEKNIVPVVKSSSPERISENINIFDFSLSPGEIKQIDDMPFCGGLGFNPDEVINFDKL